MQPPVDTTPYVNVTLQTRDGRMVRVRHLQRDDAPLLAAMFWKLSSETRWRRFFVPLDSIEPERVEREAKRLATVDAEREVALVALHVEDGVEAAVAVVRYIGPEAADKASENEAYVEGSIVVRDDFQRAGLGTQLFDLLVQVALVRGERRMVLLTHADNSGLINLVRRLGLPYDKRMADGLYELDIQLGENARPLFPFLQAR